MPRYQRHDAPDGHSHASTLELFYDLVFVFAVTQVSHSLLDRLDWTGAGQAAVILLAVWWSWNYTTWATNELDTTAVPVRAMVIAVMLASLLMSVAIPYAWEGRAELFAFSYVAIQVGRSAFLAFVVGERGSRERIRASRILIWFCASGVFWIAGGFADGPARTVLWLIALAIDYGAPLAMFWVPGMPRIASSMWDVVTEHFTERFQLFVIIALGESIILTGAVTSGIDIDAATIAAFMVAFLGSAALWWIYFNRAAIGAQRMLEEAEDRVSLARDIYTYLHVWIIAGVIVTAVGDELMTMVAGPVIYLFAQVLIRRRAAGSFSWRRQIACAAIVLIGLVAAATDAIALVVGLLVLVVLVVLIAYEEWAYRTGRNTFPIDLTP